MYITIILILFYVKYLHEVPHKKITTRNDAGGYFYFYGLKVGAY